MAQPVVFGLAYLAFALAVAIRFGAIPFHILVGRLTDAVPETGLPILIAWGPASLAIVGLAWVDASIAPLPVDVGPERAIVVAIAIASIVLATFAAWIQDDLEHVVGYSIVGRRRCRDAGLRGTGPGSLDARSDVDPRLRRHPQRVRRLGCGRCATRSGPAACRTCAAGRSDRRSSRSASSSSSWPRSDCPGSPRSRPARTWSISRSTGRSQVLVLIATLAPILYYGRLLVDRHVGGSMSGPRRSSTGVRTGRRWT